MTREPIPKAVGEQRAVSTTEMYRRVLPLLDDMGITRVADITGLDRIGIPVFAVTRPNSRSVSVAQGKGATIDDARLSGIMESIETWHAERIPPERVHVGSPDTLPHQPVDLLELPVRSDRGIEVTSTLHWIEGTDIADGSTKMVPLDLVHTDYTIDGAHDGVFLASTNGLASGTHWTDATLHGLYELIERDALALWNAFDDNRKRASRVDNLSVTSASNLALIDAFDRAGLDVGIWNITSDIRVPAFFCVVAPRESLDISSWAAIGSGSHLNREVALKRALTEAAQVRLTYILGSREDLSEAEYGAERSSFNCLARRYVDECGASESSSFEDVETFVGDELGQDLETVLEHLGHVRLNEVVTVDLYHEHHDVAVRRVVVPGLEGPDNHPLYAAGRRARTVTTS